ncbi:MAG: S-layer homology domain-containing protein [bacterium]
MRTTRSPVSPLRLRTALVVLLLGAGLILALPASAASAFPDVPSNHPYISAIVELSARGIIGGYTNGNFGPEDPVMRQQFAKMVVKTMNLSVPGGEICPFGDVVAQTGTDPFYPGKYVAVCAQYNIAKGKDATHFAPYDNITRRQVITMVVRAADNLTPGTLDDVPAGWNGQLSYEDPTHGANIKKAEYNGLLDGLHGLSSSWNAGLNASRGECAQLLYYLIFLQGGGPGNFGSLGGEFTSGPGVCEHNPQGSGGLVVFARGSDGAL